MLVRQKHLRKALLHVSLSVSDYKRLHTFVFHYHQVPHRASTSGKCQPWHEFSSIYNTIYTTMDFERRRAEEELGPFLGFEFWHFTVKVLAKMFVFLVSSGKNKISPFWPLTKIFCFRWKKNTNSLCIKFSDPQAHKFDWSWTIGKNSALPRFDLKLM